MTTNDEIKPTFIRHYCEDCDSEVANYAEHNADHTISNTPYYSQKQLADARANTVKQIFAELDRMIEELDNSLRTIGEIVLDEEKYQALKKKYEAD